MKRNVAIVVLMLGVLVWVSVAFGGNGGTISTPASVNSVPTELHTLSSVLFNVDPTPEPRMSGGSVATFSITNLATTPSTYSYEVLNGSGQFAGGVWPSVRKVTLAGGSSITGNVQFLTGWIRFVVTEVTNSGASATAKPLIELSMIAYMNSDLDQAVRMAPVIIDDFTDTVTPIPITPLTKSQG